MKSALSLALIAVFGLLLSACKTYSEDDLQHFDKKIAAYAKKSGIKYQKSSSGLYYFIEEAGEGAYIKSTDEVSFCYKGRLLNGKVFDQRYTDKALTFRVSQLIAGWQEAMLYLKKGAKAKLIVPPHLGYGDNELESIPKHAVLVFDMEIKEVK